ncbi:MAG: hypothetical protein HUJ51_02615 [Eggerthellaceae bacterium]|nr:hypothetical protein [Eggerthellaceae bacterium]
MFDNCSSFVGSAGTKFCYGHSDASCAHTDNSANIGYLYYCNIVIKPYETGPSLSHNGVEQECHVADYGYTLMGTTKATSIFNYHATVKLVSGFLCHDDTVAPVRIN